MKKIFKGLKRICLIIGTFCISIYSKVMAALAPLYGPPAQDLYGVPRTDTTSAIWKLARGLIIPIAFIIGAIIYFKKSKSSVVKKLLMTLISLAIVVLIVIGINYLITNIK